jgi:RND family efflux transporter MFP subunit
MRKGRFLILLSIGACFLFGCKETTQPKKLVRPVKVMELNREPLVQISSFPAISAESKEVTLAFRVRGPLVKLNVKEGERVEKGQLIAEIDPRDFQIQLATAKANYFQAREEAKRYEELYQRKGISINDLEKIQMVRDIAQANYQSAQNALKDTRLITPFSGYVERKFVENFETVQVGAPILSLLDVSRMEVEAGIPESLVLQSEQFCGFECEFDVLKGKRFNARLKELGKKASGQGQTYPVTVIVDSEANHLIRPGMNATLRILVKGEAYDEGFVVPVTSVINRKGSTCVWVFNTKEEMVHSRNVNVERILPGGKMLISGKLKEGEKLVVMGGSYLTESQKVKELKEVSASNVGGEL